MTPALLNHVRCAHCSGKLDLRKDELHCSGCSERFPVLDGVAILVKNPEEYIYLHAKGISRFVKKTQIPKKYQDAFLTALSEIAENDEHIEEDLEAERVNALYIMNHFIEADIKNPFWKTPGTPTNAEIETLILKYWNKSPLSEIAGYFQKNKTKNASLVELGCGVGGLLKNLSPHLETYLGIDESFASVAFARKLFLEPANEVIVQIPQDLIDGTVSKKVKIKKPQLGKTQAEFIVGNVEAPPVAKNTFTHCAALNVIDMLDEPANFPAVQHSLLKSNGIAIESSPYIWHQKIAKKLKKQVKNTPNSAKTISELYATSGFKIKDEIENYPWLFFKHFRQLEIYSTHMIFAEKER